MTMSFRKLLLLFSWISTYVHLSLAEKSYVVYLGSSPETVDKYKVAESHHQLLKHVLKSSGAVRKALLYSYIHGFNGFAAKLAPEQATKMSAIPSVVSVFPNRRNTLHTTRSWEFMGLENLQGEFSTSSLWNRSNFGKDVIVGFLDTGVWPESQSFNDDSFEPVPSRWKGTCVTGTAFNSSHCNKKLIGARYYIKGYEQENGPLNITATGNFKSPRDKDGHGTHTSSTAAGRFVQGASTFGFANGTAKGGAALARVSIYKVCWPQGGNESACYDADILAAMDDAIQDGVDILSLSIGGSIPAPQLFEDGISVGAFHALQKGILVVSSAGNAGPAYGSVVNLAPWIVTVAASSIDRQLSSYVVLGDNTTFKGASLSDSKLESDHLYPLVSGSAIPASSAKPLDSALCKPGSLDPEKAKGKIVVCLRGSNSRVSKGETVRLAGGLGMVLANTALEGSDTVADAHVLPACHVDAAAGASILAFINSSSSPTATLTPVSTVVDMKPAPTMASFSSQGPNTLIPDILKPDVTAPGVNILAAFTEASSPTGLSTDARVLKFNVMSGTSMACPHVTGVAALLKALHPEWSPTAIKSAMMTTAKVRDNREQLILGYDSQLAGPFSYGSGHVNPNAAADPGLVYDATTQDYLLLLCSLKYNSSTIKTLSGQDFTCPSAATATVTNFNYPTITVSKLTSGVTTVTRTLTSVTDCISTYEVFVKPPAGVTLSVRPTRLMFSGVGQKQSFVVSMNAKQGAGDLDSSNGGNTFGYLLWSDGKHQVRSSIAVNAGKSFKELVNVL